MQITILMRRVGCKYNELNRNLKLFEAAGIITNEYRIQIRHPKIRIIHLMMDNPRTQILLKIVKILSAEDNTPEQRVGNSSRNNNQQKIFLIIPKSNSTPLYL